MKTTIYNKLVRDRVPEIIKGDGEVPVTSRLLSTEYKKELLSKLVEESKEAEATINDRKQLIIELADLSEVLSAVMGAMKITFGELSKVRRNRRKERGGFEGRIFLKSINKK